MLKPLASIARAGETLLDRVLCVAGAVVFSQAPEFMQQYFQRLGGHLDEARRQLAQFEQIAAESGETLAAFAARTASAADPTLARLSEVINATITRVENLSAALAALRDAAPWSRPFAFLQNLQIDIASATWSAFKPAVPTTLEGGLYAAAGMVVFLLTYHAALRTPIATALRRNRARRASRELPVVRR